MINSQQIVVEQDRKAMGLFIVTMVVILKILDREGPQTLLAGTADVSFFFFF